MPNDCGCGTCGFCRHYAADAGFRGYWDARPAKLARLAAQRAGQPAGPAPSPRGPCRWLGEATGRFVTCPTCRGVVKLKLFACEVFGSCTLSERVEGVDCCDAQCDGYVAGRA